METYNENSRPITPPSDHHNKRTSGNFTGSPIPNLQYVDQTMPTTGAATNTTDYHSGDTRSSSIINDSQHSGLRDRHNTGYSPALKNVDAIDPTYSPNLHSNTTNEDGFLGRNVPQHNLSPNTTSKSQERVSLDPHLEKENELSKNTTHRQLNGSQRNETTLRIEREVYQILHWNKPVRSGIALASVVGSLLLTRWYSPLQMSAAGLTMATLINIIYVNFMVQSQKVISNTQTSQHPYNNVVNNEHRTYINRASVSHYSTVFIEVAETIIRALTRIVFVEDTLTSMKWMSIFFIIWKVSAHVSTMNILLVLAISAFTFPRLYLSNKDVVDAHLQKSQQMIQNGLMKAQETAEQGVKDAYGKARSYVSQANIATGANAKNTTGTDVKNTINNTSATLKNQ